MNDPATIALYLTFAGTLSVGLLLFIGQVLAYTALLILAALGGVIGLAVRLLLALIRALNRQKNQTDDA